MGIVVLFWASHVINGYVMSLHKLFTQICLDIKQCEL